MNRLLLHGLFWCCYFLATALIDYLWGKATLPQMTDAQLLVAVISAGLLEAVAKIFFAYYVAYYALDKIIKKTRPPLLNIGEMLLALFVCVVIDRVITNELILPYSYYYQVPWAPLFEPRRVAIVIIFALLVAGLMSAIRLVRGELVRREREKNLVKEKLEAELKFLRNQTNPHFILNTLNNIYALARKRSADTAEVVLRLSELLKFMLYESGNNQIPLADEIKFLQDYLELEMIRYSERLTVSFNNEIDAGDYLITPLVLLPFVENAFKHGVGETRFESFINIDMTVKKGKLNFSIENSFEPLAGLNNKQPIGLTNTKRQLELTYREYDLDIQTTQNIFSVNLFINLHSYAEI
ncbi:MAG TPA: histidine kinase [Chitinophagaceae bacterium]|nr:histidine kinase [Chitinophagaceae bacterium]